ncbi:MAG: immune inhibitor A, partial [Acidobacteria bacterium]|nr:immune inhibitor A [Acidobacteriota bacterium]
ERPRGATDQSKETIWAEDFNRSYYDSLIFGNGFKYTYKRQDASEATVDLDGRSVRTFYLDMSNGRYVIEGEIYGWVKVPHSAMWYGADQCPGARSVPGEAMASIQRGGAIPGAGNERSLVTDVLSATKAAYPTLDWARYDVNKDGLIDRLWIIYAGLGEEDAPTLISRMPNGEGQIWSQAGNLSAAYEVVPGIKAVPYILMPENSGINVLAHESGHNLGAIDLYSEGGGNSSAGFWTNMSDSWTGSPNRSMPPAFDPLHLEGWGWLDPYTISDSGKEYVVVLGQASEFPGGAGVYRGARIALPDLAPEMPVQPQGLWQWWFGKKTATNSLLTLITPLALPASPPAVLTFDVAYKIDGGYDFFWVQASTDGKTWKTLTNQHTTCNHASNWEGDKRGGFPNDLCAAQIGGFTGTSSKYPLYSTESFDLSAFANQPRVMIAFWYMSDGTNALDGVFLDNVRVTLAEQPLFADGAEVENSIWRYGEVQRNDGTQPSPTPPSTHNYYLQWRNTSSTGGFDQALGKPAWRFGPADSGMLVWYNNNSYQDNNVSSHLFDKPSFGPKGIMQLVDSHPEPLRDPDLVAQGYSNEASNLRTRLMMRDAPFSLLPGQPYTARVSDDLLASQQAGTWVKREVTYPAASPVSRFSDSQGYYPGAEEVSPGPKNPGKQWMTRQWDSSVVVPSRKPYGMKAPGYRAGTQLLYNCRVIEDGTVNCPPGANATSVAFDGGNGNPADVNGQYGWHVQIFAQTDKKGVVQVWNGTQDPSLVATHGATFRVGGVSPGLIVTFFGSDIGPPALAGLELTPAGMVSTNLGGTRVLFDNVPAPLIYTYATQVSAVVPYSVAGKAVTEVRIEYKGKLTKPLVLPVTLSAPGLFTANSSGAGQGAILNQNYSVNSSSNPAEIGSVVILYATGEGQTTPAGVDGKPAMQVYPAPNLPVSVTIGGKQADVLYAGAAPYFVAGVLQINAKIPEGITAGNAVPVMVKIGDEESPPGVTLAVRAP